MLVPVDLADVIWLLVFFSGFAFRPFVDIFHQVIEGRWSINAVGELGSGSNDSSIGLTQMMPSKNVNT